MPVTDLDTDAFVTETRATQPAIVQFHAEWCGPCRFFERKFWRLSKTRPDVRFFRVDIEKTPIAKSDLGITELPWFAVYRDGRVNASKHLKTEEDLIAMLDEVIPA